MTSLLHDLVRRHAERTPDARAVVLGPSTLTYGELESSSNRLARLLRATGCSRGDRVCLFLPKSPAAVTCMLAALKADCAYVPVDVGSPAPRVAKIVESAEPAVAFVAAEAAALVDELVATGALGTEVVIISTDAALVTERFEPRFAPADWAALDGEPFGSANASSDLAHVLFTSGSTGTPKGVMITHANVMHFVEWAVGYFGTRASDRVSGHPPLHFDLSTFDIFGTFHAGAELHLVPPQLNLLPPKLAGLIRDSQLTQWFSVPSTMTHMASFGVVEPGAFPSLERVIWCGEVLPTPTLRVWMEAVPDATFTNLYGPTEATIASSYYAVPELPDPQSSIPIGTACAGEELLVLDGELTAVGAGEIGDLYIGGVGLSPGYWRDEEKTRASFVADPRREHGSRIYRTGDLARVEDGLVHFLGRADSQIKSRGYRIELGEIEACLNALDGIVECAVVGVDVQGLEGTTICCAFVVDDESRDPDAIRTHLRRELPSYMLPRHWLRMDVLPKNVNGKIDRRAVRELFETDIRDARTTNPLTAAPKPSERATA